MRLVLLLAFLISFLSSSAQEIETTAGFSLIGIFSSEDIIPAWFYTNTATALGPMTNFSGELNGSVRYKLSDNTGLEAGTSWLYRDGVEDEIARKDLYLQFRNPWLEVTAGAKTWPILTDGLSATNKNFLWSLNARPLAGLLVQANQPLVINKIFAIDWGIAHYELNDERYVSDPKVHYKRLGLYVNFNENHKLYARLQHFAQWDGFSPVFGELPDGFDGFFNVFFAREREETGADNEINNAVGNHLGSYYLQYNFNTTVGAFEVYHEHPFEDGSGTRLVNVPDGVYGLQYIPANQKIISKILYEYIDTSDQSGIDPGRGFDGYFGNSVYRSGWSYEQNIIGFPFFIYDPDLVVNNINSPVISNRTKAHNLGLVGTAHGILWKLKSTYVRNSGTLRNPFETPLENWLNYASFSYPTQVYGEFTLIVGADFSNLNDTVVAAGVGYSYRL